MKLVLLSFLGLACSVSVGDYSECELPQIPDDPEPCSARALGCLGACEEDDPSCVDACFAGNPECDTCVRAVSAKCGQMVGCEAQYVDVICCALGECPVDRECGACASTFSAYEECVAPFNEVCQQMIFDACLPGAS